ncbi:MAG: RNA polymerase sigma factor [Candidatus Binatia bacterium]
MSEGISDLECVQRLRRGEIDVFEVLVRRYQKTIFNLVYRVLGDYEEAAEISQEVFLSAYRSIRQFRGDASFSTWLYRIALNHASTQRKTMAKWQQRTAPLDTANPVSDHRLDPGHALEQKQTRERVQRALGSLEPNDALIILLRDLHDVPYEEVAQILAVPLGTVKSRLYRARQALKLRLTAYVSSNGNEP